MPTKDGAFLNDANIIAGMTTDKNTVPVAVNNDGELIVNIEASSITIGSVDINDAAGNPLTSTGGSLNVNVTGGAGDSVTVINGTGAAAVNIQDGGNSLTVDGPVTNTELRATPVPVSGPLTDAQLRATAVPVSSSSLPLPTGAATEATLSSLNSKVTAVNTGAVVIASGTTTVTQATGTNLHVVVDTAPTTAVTGPLTDTQLRATAVPVSGTVTVTPSGTQTVTGNKTSNNAAPGATNIGTLGGVATAAAPSYSEGNQVALSTDLSGALRVSGSGVAQASTTSGQNGILVQGAVTTAAPTYTTAQTNPLSLTTGGALRVTDANNALAQASTTSGQLGTLGLAACLTTVPTYVTGQTYPPVLNSVGALQITATTSANGVADNLTNSLNFNSFNTTIASVPVNLCSYGGAFAGTTDAARKGFSKVRQNTVFRTASATNSGNTAVWTAGTGNKWRLLAYRIICTANVSNAGGVNTIKFQDVTTDINITYDIFVPTVAVTTVVGAGYDTGWVNIGGFGILAAAVSTALNVNLSTTMSTGSVRIIVAGVEE